MWSAKYVRVIVVHEGVPEGDVTVDGWKRPTWSWSRSVKLVDARVHQPDGDVLPAMEERGQDWVIPRGRIVMIGALAAPATVMVKAQ